MARFYQPKKNTSINKKHQSVLIDKLDHQGSGIAFLNKKPVFIDGALPTETVLMQLTESKSKYARGQLIKVQKPSEQRVVPFCPHYQVCGGCDLQHLERAAQVEYKQQTLSQLMAKFAGESLSLAKPILGQDTQYRRRARLSLFWSKTQQQLQFGFRQRQSKHIATITECPVLTPRLNRHLAPLKAILETFKRPDMLGHLELVEGSNGVGVLLRFLSTLSEQDASKLRDYAQNEQITLYFMPENNELIREIGEELYYDENGVKTPFTPVNFIQVNRDVNEHLVTQAMDWLEVNKEDRVLDLFCGLGNFSLPMAQQAQHVTGIEGIDEMVLKAQDNARINQLDNVSYYQANLADDLTEQTWAQQTFDKILLDPARAGATGLIDQMGHFAAQRIVYVSCNPATLARDSQRLLAQGYKLAKLGMLDMFPHTSHLESMALFIKS
ncbi:23S rRNA (uracil(1939)-C(5))-methyltransferase RlmD [Vibrio palustris]|uniref:23S rRNA (uracil(1939)-C(5))-methyltransferase RlmD n=1 Tax=Vibrio palustris TaxID=1918946 RepID=A0A1R4B8R4_9VIBR|nr:23S rRNA (uracil(1939)-C(5))-methyltransferase RlmD [Vibrio palustris]SJL85231.1 23S rRNA (uracil(1939)-C(5))-methyltransferase RlmD [Vibrio palustris]